MAEAIVAEGLTKHYGDVIAVDGVSFTVAEGEIFGYLGRNGSGKTTTVRMLTTLARPDSGSAAVAGYDVDANSTEVKARIGVTMQDAALDPQMSGTEHLTFIAQILGNSARDAATRSGQLLEQFGLTDAAARPIGTYSGGMKRRLDIATSLLGEPAVLFLDEPTTGLDPQSRRAMWEEIRRLKTNGSTVFLTTQYLEEADQLADHLAIIDQGKIIAAGSTKALKAQHGRRQISFEASPALIALIEEPNLAVPFETDSVDGRIHLSGPPDVSNNDLINLVTDISNRAGDLDGLQITATSLEDVFLRLTGRSINESSQPADPATSQ